jgi:osmoprotectant transport system ATP-binding protein
VTAGTSLRDALAVMFAAGVDMLAVTGADGAPIGVLTVSGVRRHALAEPSIDSARASP